MSIYQNMQPYVNIRAWRSRTRKKQVFMISQEIRLWFDVRLKLVACSTIRQISLDNRCFIAIFTLMYRYFLVSQRDYIPFLVAEVVISAFW